MARINLATDQALAGAGTVAAISEAAHRAEEEALGAHHHDTIISAVNLALDMPGSGRTDALLAYVRRTRRQGTGWLRAAASTATWNHRPIVAG